MYKNSLGELSNGKTSSFFVCRCERVLDLQKPNSFHINFKGAALPTKELRIEPRPLRFKYLYKNPLGKHYFVTAWGAATLLGGQPPGSLQHLHCDKYFLGCSKVHASFRRNMKPCSRQHKQTWKTQTCKI